MARKLSARRWQESARDMSLKRGEAALHEAERVFRRELSRDEQHALTREVARARATELCLAYPNVVTIGYGTRVRRRRGGTREPCVTFYVKRKWKSEPGNKAGAIPKSLLAYWTVDGQRTLCAVPTDVEDSHEFSSARAQARAQVLVGDANSARLGTLCCAVHRDDELFTLSCRHVMSASGALDVDTNVSDANTGALIASTTKFAGPLKAGLQFSLDAQLAKIVDIEALGHTLGHVSFHGIADPNESFPSRAFILRSGERPVEVKRARLMLNKPLPYDALDANSNLTEIQIHHDEVIVSEFKTTRSTKQGDSGSALVSDPEGGVLLGMHIAGDEKHAYAIPAWDLLTPSLYGDDSAWRLVEEPEELSSLDDDESPPEDPDVLGASGLPLWLELMTFNHNVNGGVRWRLSKNGLHIENEGPEITDDDPETVARVWTSFEDSIVKWSTKFDVPVELIVATICTESGGDETSTRHEPGFVSDATTPHRVSIGLMQTLISTASEALRRRVSRADLKRPDVSIEAGTAYIARQRRKTDLDPPKVACAYNAGGVYRNNGAANRWKMKQYRVGTGEHADRFVKWFNDCFRYFDAEGNAPPLSYYRLLRSGSGT